MRRGLPPTVAGRLALGSWLVTVALIGITTVFGLMNDSFGVAEFVVVSLVYLSFATVGALVASHHPGNAIGWLFCCAALLMMSSNATGEYATYAHAHAWPGVGATGWLAQWTWSAGCFLVASFLLLLFPDGRLPSRRWRPVAWLAGVSLALFLIGTAFAVGPAGLATRDRGEPARSSRREAPPGTGPARDRDRDPGRGRIPGPAVPSCRDAAAPAAQVVRHGGVRQRGLRSDQRREPGRRRQLGAARRGVPACHRHDPDIGWRRDPAAPPLRRRRDHQPHAGLWPADGDARGDLPGHGAAAAAGAAAGHLAVEPGGRGVDAGGGGAVPPGTSAVPGGGRPPLLPPQVRRRAHARASARGSATRSTSTRSAASCAPWCRRRCSPPTCRSGCAHHSPEAQERLGLPKVGCEPASARSGAAACPLLPCE